MEPNNNTPAINIDTFTVLVSKTPAILRENEDSVNKANLVGNVLVKEIEALHTLEFTNDGKPDFAKRKAVDEKLNNYLIRIGQTAKKLKDTRTPVTGLFDDLKKLFTGLEARIDVKNPGTIPNFITSTRNTWAADKAREQQRVQSEQMRVKAVEAEKIRIKSEIELQLKTYFLTFTDNEQTAFINKFENLTLANFDFEAQQLINFEPAYPFIHFEGFKPTVSVQYLNTTDIGNILVNAKMGKFEEFAVEFKETLLGIKEIFVEKLASKKAELQEIANANAVEKQRLEKEAEQRKIDEAEKLKQQNATKIEAANTQAKVTQQTAATTMLFDMQVTQGGANTNIKEGVEIIVKNSTGWLNIIAFYFEKEGMSKLPDDLGKMKLEQMKTFCEKLYMKTGTSIDSPNLEYKDIYKAIVKK